MTIHQFGDNRSERLMPLPGKWAVAPIMLFTASLFMAFAWLGHLKFQELPFFSALFLCWLLVLPEYFLNVSAIRLGYKFFTGAQMAAFRLCSGVICVALVSHFFLNEALSSRKLLGFALMVVAMALIAIKRPSAEDREHLTFATTQILETETSDISLSSSAICKAEMLPEDQTSPAEGEQYE